MAKKTLWELLWDYDPNGLIAVDREMKIRVVNPAFCRLFQVRAEDAIGKPAAAILGDTREWQQLWQEDRNVSFKEKHYPDLGIYVRQVMFAIEDEGILACIMVDLTHEWQQQNELRELKRATVEKVTQVVNNQMKVAQEIASLLGETTAESKVHLLKLVHALKQDIGENQA
ncbi:MAG TPA: PAS domain-containing protein [Terriglobales bacterium]|nr:PAS domain-containing protein [Terriglobales bacterium]